MKKCTNCGGVEFKLALIDHKYNEGSDQEVLLTDIEEHTCQNTDCGETFISIPSSRVAHLDDVG